MSATKFLSVDFGPDFWLNLSLTIVNRPPSENATYKSAWHVGDVGDKNFCRPTVGRQKFLSPTCRRTKNVCRHDDEFLSADVSGRFVGRIYRRCEQRLRLVHTKILPLLDRGTTSVNDFRRVAARQSNPWLPGCMFSVLTGGLDWPLWHCAVAQAPLPHFDEHRRPLAPSKFFDNNGNFSLPSALSVLIIQ